MNTCRNCRFFQLTKFPASASGLCHCHPDHAHIPDSSSDWCGEWEPAAAQEEAPAQPARKPRKKADVQP